MVRRELTFNNDGTYTLGNALSEYTNLFNEDLLNRKQEEIQYLKKQELIKISDNRLFTTYKGMLLLDMVILKLI